MGLMNRAGRLLQEKIKRQMSQRVPCDFIPPLKEIYRTTIFFGKPEPLGTEMRNEACLRLGTMLHLEIQNWEEAMKTSKFEKELGGTTACMKIIVIDNKGCGQLTSNET